MQKANFKMGSILPEHNGYRVQQLEKSPSGATLGLTRNTSNFKANKILNSQTVSSGNNVAKGNGSFQTVNQ